MLTEHEQLADREARISRQELPPLQQPLDNIEEIRQALNNEWQPFESAPDVVDLLWYFSDTKDYIVYRKSVIEQFKDVATWQHLPPPPKDNNV